MRGLKILQKIVPKALLTIALVALATIATPESIKAVPSDWQNHEVSKPWWDGGSCWIVLDATKATSKTRWYTSGFPYRKDVHLLLTSKVL